MAAYHTAALENARKICGSLPELRGLISVPQECVFTISAMRTEECGGNRVATVRHERAKGAESRRRGAKIP
jgi:hypothetical protein